MFFWQKILLWTTAGGREHGASERGVLGHVCHAADVRGAAMCGDDGWREGGVQVRKKLGVSHNEFISQGGNKWRWKKFKGD